MDGGMGTRLIEKGLRAGELPEFWNIAYPESIKEIHQSYIKAGSKIIYTNTFGANRLKLKRAQKVNFLERFNTAAVRLAKEVAGDKVLVAGDVGPTGEFLQPYGGWEEKEFYQAFREQIDILVSEKVDLIVLETFSDLREIQVALRAAKEAGSLPVFASMSFEKGKGGYRTIMGVSLEEMVEGLKEADAIGINCGGIYPGEAGEVIKEMKNCTDKPILVKLNAGKSKIVEGKVEYELGPEKFAQDMLISLKAGAKFIGGCCGTTEKHIFLLNKLIRATAA